MQKLACVLQMSLVQLINVPLAFIMAYVSMKNIQICVLKANKFISAVKLLNLKEKSFAAPHKKMTN